MLKKIAIVERQMPTRDSDEDENADKGAVPDDRKQKYDGLMVKSYNRYFIDWLENYVKKNKNKTSKFIPDQKDSKLRIVSEFRTYPGVWLRIKGFGFSIKNEIAGKRVFSISGDDIRETV